MVIKGIINIIILFIDFINRELEIAFIFYTIYDEKEITDEMIYKIDRETNNKSILDKDIRDSIEDFDEVNNKEENEEEIELNEK